MRVVSDLKYWDIFKDPLWLLNNLFDRWKVIPVPHNGGWATSNIGSGGTSQSAWYLAAYTGTTANSRGLASSIVFPLNSGDISRHYIDWSKRLEIYFDLARFRSDAEAVARIQLKETPSEGALAQRGIGIEINNYNMLGEGYGTARSTVSIGSLTDDRMARIRIVKTNTAIDFYVNGVLQGSLTGAAVPNVQGGATGYMVVSIINGATGGVDAVLYVSDIWILQAW